MTSTAIPHQVPAAPDVLERRGHIPLAIIVVLGVILVNLWTGLPPHDPPNCNVKADQAGAPIMLATTDSVFFCQDSILGEEREILPPGAGGTGAVEFSLQPR